VGSKRLAEANGGLRPINDEVSIVLGEDPRSQDSARFSMGVDSGPKRPTVLNSDTGQVGGAPLDETCSSVFPSRSKGDYEAQGPEWGPSS
jgi:hypothetical protein